MPATDSGVHSQLLLLIPQVSPEDLITMELESLTAVTQTGQVENNRVSKAGPAPQSLQHPHSWLELELEVSET